MIKITIPKGQIDEPKTPFQHGIYGSSKNVHFTFNLYFMLGCDESGDDVFKLRDAELTGQSENEASFSVSGGWESSMSEFETDADASSAKEEDIKHEKFKSLRAQHYFMRQSLQRGKELIGTDDDE